MQQSFDGDRALKLVVESLVDLTHPAAANEPQDSEAADPVGHHNLEFYRTDDTGTRAKLDRPRSKPRHGRACST
jgi:hypothetical protein